MLNANVSNFYAQICNRPNKGFSECHWCGAKASQGVIHDEPPPIPFIRSATQKLAARQRNPWLCNGCVLWRQSSITTWSLQGKIKDGRSPMRCSWWLTEKSALEIRLPDDAQALWKLLLKPPLRFCLALLDYADALVKLHDKTGISIEGLQQLQTMGQGDEGTRRP